MSNWTFRKWVRESRRYMAHLPAFKFYYLAIIKWPAFNRQQKIDLEDLDALRYQKDS